MRVSPSIMETGNKTVRHLLGCIAHYSRLLEHFMNPNSGPTGHTIFTLAVYPADSGRAFRALGGVLGCSGTSKSVFPRGLALHPEIRFTWS